MHFYYAGDGNLNRIVSWFQGHIRAIGICIENKLPEASLALIYSGIDTLGFLASPVNNDFATRKTFEEWCDQYIVPKLTTVEGQPLTSIDLYAARCGILHTSTPLSALSQQGKAHECWYQFGEETGINIILNTPSLPSRIDVVQLALALKEGGLAFISDLNENPTNLQTADSRAQHFLRWGKVESHSSRQDAP